MWCFFCVSVIGRDLYMFFNLLVFEYGVIFVDMNMMLSRVFVCFVLFEFVRFFSICFCFWFFLLGLVENVRVFLGVGVCGYVLMDDFIVLYYMLLWLEDEDEIVFRGVICIIRILIVDVFNDNVWLIWEVVILIFCSFGVKIFLILLFDVMFL